MPGKRFLSLQIIDEDEYTPHVFYGAGVHTLAKADIGTRYVLAALRVLADPNDPKDLDAAHALQDAVTASPAGRSWRIQNTGLGPGEPDRDPPGAARTRGQPARHERHVRAEGEGRSGPPPGRRAAAWGGNPEEDALYLNVSPPKNDGKTIYRLAVKDVPVDGFWSVSVYDGRGYFEPNPQNVYSLNSVTRPRAPDGSVAIQFGGCDAAVPNCLPIMPRWNYMVRLYRPRAEILSGAWKFPAAQPAS